MRDEKKIAQYMDAAAGAMAIINGRQRLIDWWAQQGEYRDSLGLTQDEKQKLYEAWKARGRAIVVSSSATTIRSKVSA